MHQNKVLNENVSSKLIFLLHTFFHIRQAFPIYVPNSCYTIFLNFIMFASIFSSIEFIAQPSCFRCIVNLVIYVCVGWEYYPLLCLPRFEHKRICIRLSRPQKRHARNLSINKFAIINAAYWHFIH